MQTICITGATGFVGQGVLPALLDAGFRVHALVRPGSEKKLPHHPMLTAFEGDVLETEAIARALMGSQALVHLTGIKRAETKRTGLTYEDVDLGSVLAVLPAMNKVSVKRIVLLSAADVGHSFYVRTKQRTEQAVIDAGVDWTILRPSYIIGKGQRWPIIMSPFLNLLALLPGHYGNIAKRARSVTRVQLAAAIVHALKSETAIGKVWDVSAIRAIA